MVSVFHKKLCILAGCVLTIMFFMNSMSTIKSGVYYYFYPKEGIQCYRVKENSMQDISDTNPEKGRSIFFHETSCNSFYNGKISITSRQACAVESAAKMNPTMDVYLLFTSPGLIKFEGSESDGFLRALLTYSNVKIHHLDYEKYTRNTPLEELYASGDVDKSMYAQSHASDVLRYLTLWKYGGIYLDLDVVVVKSFESLPKNFAGLESENNVAAGIMGFDHTGVGHNMAKTCVNDLKHNFKGNDWGYNGPGTVTRLLKKACGADKGIDMLDKDCQGFSVFPPEYFYAIPWQNWTMYFDEHSTNDVIEASKRSYIIHVWNKHSSVSKIPLSTQVPYLIYAQKFCPKVYKQCIKYF